MHINTKDVRSFLFLFRSKNEFEGFRTLVGKLAFLQDPAGDVRSLPVFAFSNEHKRAGGRAVVNVAAMPILTGNHSVLAHELRRYNASGLRRLLEDGGFVIERLTYTNATILPILLPLRLVHRMMGLAPEEDAGDEISVPPKLVNFVCDRLLAIEAAVVRRVDLPCGSSLLALARRPS